jgi:hypothetical protein
MKKHILQIATDILLHMMMAILFIADIILLGLPIGLALIT